MTAFFLTEFISLIPIHLLIVILVCMTIESGGGSRRNTVIWNCEIHSSHITSAILIYRSYTYAIITCWKFFKGIWKVLSCEWLLAISIVPYFNLIIMSKPTGIPRYFYVFILKQIATHRQLRSIGSISISVNCENLGCWMIAFPNLNICAVFRRTTIYVQRHIDSTLRVQFISAITLNNSPSLSSTIITATNTNICSVYSAEICII